MGADSRLTRRLFALMLREEWRVNAALFGRRFAAFPFLIALMAGGGFWLLTLTNTSMATIAAGVHGLVFFFGLQTGTIGLVGRDALRDAIGDVTMLVFSARTLPVTWRRLLATFVVKDLCYYSGLFLVPLVAGYAAVALTTGTGVGTVLLLWATTTATFALGVATSLTLSGLGTRSGALVTVVVALVAVAILWDGVDPVALTPYALFRAPTLRSAIVGLGPTVVLSVVAPLLFEPAESGQTRTGNALYPQLRSVVGRNRPVAARTLVEVVRSSGSVTKVLFSMGVLFGVTILLVQEVGRATALKPSPGIAVGTLLGLGAFTTYSWITQYDAADEYLRYPTTMASVFAGKRRAYLPLSLPAGGVYLVLSLLWVSPSEVLVAAVVFPLVAVYVFGVTAIVAGLSPNGLLFDTPRFALFGATLAVVAVPLVTAALAQSAAPTLARSLAVGLAAVSALVGVWLSHVAGPRWGKRVRRRG